MGDDLKWLNEIVQGDCLRLVDELSVDDIDICFFDPPYNIGFSGYSNYVDSMDDEDYIELLSKFKKFKKVIIIQYPEQTAKYITPVFGTPSHVGVWCYNSNSPRRFRLINYFGIIPDYSRIKQPYKNPSDKRVKKLISSGSVGTDLYEWWSDISQVKGNGKEKLGHPCPLPIELVRRILLLSSDVGDVILDPFMGSGTTAAAAKGTNRNFIGFELSEKYCEIARKRIAETPAPLFV
jgi:site-specific DNA-methyltransferase (adenine-specific)